MARHPNLSGNEAAGNPAVSDKPIEDETSGIVADGRTVHDGKKLYGPGETVNLSVDDIKSLRKAGFLVNPSAEKIPTGNGPTFSSDEGPSVKAAS